LSWMCGSRFCWRSGLVKGRGATRARCRGCSTWRQAALLSGVVLADAEFDSEANHQHIRQRLGAKSIIPARRRGVPNGAIRNQMFRAFPKKPYRQRAKIESVFSAVNVSSPRAHRGEAWQRRSAKPCCSAWPTTSTA